MLVPDKIVSNSVRYLVRTEPGRRDELMPVVEEALAQSNRQRIVRAPQSMAETRAFGYWLDSGISTTLGVVMAALLLITSFGIVGLASFSVRQRTRQIGTRRALGATRADILRYFLVENFLIATGGVLLGAVLYGRLQRLAGAAIAGGESRLVGDTARHGGAVAAGLAGGAGPGSQGQRRAAGGGDKDGVGRGAATDIGAPMHRGGADLSLRGLKTVRRRL